MAGGNCPSFQAVEGYANFSGSRKKPGFRLAPKAFSVGTQGVSYVQPGANMTDKLRVKSLLRGELPPQVREDLNPVLLHYSVNLVGILDGPRPAHCGSGTLVSYRNRRYVLTAGHCAERVTRQDVLAVGLVLVDYRHQFLIDKPFQEDPIFVDRPAEYGDDSEWGPDMAFLPIPENQVGTLAAVKSFCNLDRLEKSMLEGTVATERGLMAFVGAPADTSDLRQPTDLEFAQTVHWSYTTRLHEKGEHDFLEMDATDSDFRGVSGGGLWHVDIVREGDRWGHLSPILEGCVFYQTKIEDSTRFVRCHGRRSLYGRGLAALRHE